MEKHQERLKYDLKRMEELMFKKDVLIKEQVFRIHQLEECNYRTEIVRIQQQLDEYELLMKRKEDELVNKAKIITHLHEELKETKDYLGTIVKSKENEITLLREEKEQGIRDMERMDTRNTGIFNLNWMSRTPPLLLAKKI